MRWIVTTLAAMWLFAAPGGALVERSTTDPTGVAGATAADASSACACPVRTAPPVPHSVRSLPPFTVAASAPALPQRARAWQAPHAAARPVLPARRAPVSSRGPPVV